MDATVFAVIRVAINVLGDRLLTFTSLLMVFALACWAMYMPSQERLIVAGGFAILVFVPAVLKEKRRERPIQPEFE